VPKTKRSILSIGRLLVLSALVVCLFGCDYEAENTRDAPSIEEPVDQPEDMVSEECLNARMLGSITTVDTPALYLIGAPHGTFDFNTAPIVESICQSLSWNCVVARKYTVEGVRINVNRPSEGANLAPNDEIRSARSQCVFDYYVQMARSVSHLEDLKLYVEIHGAGIETIEIATVGVSPQQAARIKVALLSALNSPGQGFIDIKIQPIDAISLGATASKTFGMLSLVSPVLHIEMPAGLRVDEPVRVRDFLRVGLAEVARTEFQ